MAPPVGLEAASSAAANLFVLGAREGRPGSKVVAQLMGHAKVDTTLNVYTQVRRRCIAAGPQTTVGSELFTIVHKPEERAS